MDPTVLERENLNSLIPSLYSGPEKECLNNILLLKNLVIGSNKQKENVIQAGIVPRLLHLFIEETANDGQLVYEIGALLCSLAKGTPKHIRLLIDCNTIQTILKKLTQCSYSDNLKLIEICLRTLRSIFMSGLAPPSTIYTPQHSGVPFIAYLLNMASPNANSSLKCSSPSDQEDSLIVKLEPASPNVHTWCIQECVLNILAASCQSAEQQNMLCEYSCVQTVADLLLTCSIKVSRPALTLLAKICYQNELVSLVAVNTVSRQPSSYSDLDNHQQFPAHNFPTDIKLLETLSELLDCDDLQLHAAKCVTNLFRANAFSRETSKVHEAYIFKTMRVLTKLCKKEHAIEVRIEAANILAYLIELDPELQKITSICDHIIASLAEFFNYDSRDGLSMNGDVGLNDTFNTSRSRSPTAASNTGNISSVKRQKQEEELQTNLKEAAFKCFASLAASDEEIRKNIISTDELMENTVSGLSDPSTRVRLAALRCLHSLSRSVQQLRTTFQDHAVWIPLKTLLLATTDDTILSVASSTLCNLLIEFSPTKQHFLDRGAVELLCSLTKREQNALRTNGVWALMNMAFQADPCIKMQILDSLGMDHISTLLSDSDPEVLLKTLGLIRNLLAAKAHADSIMSLHGKKIMDEVTVILNSDRRLDQYGVEIREQALCILANIATGDTAREFVMKNDDILNKVLRYLDGDNEKLQIAACFVVNNLVWYAEPTAVERQKKLEQMGFHKILEKLLKTSNDALFDRVKTALQHCEQDN